MTFSESTVIESLENDESIEEAAKKVSNDISSGKCEISSFVENLGVALTSPSVELRVNGTKLLSSTLVHLPSEYLNEDQVGFIASFYCDRLKDHHSVLPAVFDGIQAVFAMKHCPKGSASKILTSFFQHVTCQSQVREDREKIYSIIEIMCDRYYEELTKMGPDFIYGIINCIDGERDPRNLSFLFRFMPQFVHKFPPGHLSEELFETFACYFPIDFHPSKNDPASITREHLAENLANCLVCTESFADNTIGLLLEKLESDLLVAKLDSLHLLSRCCDQFKAEILENHFAEIWKALKSEILPGSDNKDVINATLLLLRKMLAHFSKYVNISKNAQTLVMADILPYLTDTEHRLFAPSCSIAILCVDCDPDFASEKVLNTILLKICCDDADGETQVRMLTFTKDVLKVCCSKKFLNKIHEDVIISLQNHFVKVLTSKFGETNEISLECVGIIAGILSPTNRRIIYDILTRRLINPQEKVKLNRVVESLALYYPEEVREYILKNLFNTFDSFDKNVQRQIFSAVAVLISIPFFEPDVIDFLSNHIFRPKREDTQLEAIQALETCLKTSENNNFIDKLYAQHGIIDKLFTLALNDATPDEILSKIKSVLNLLIQKLPIEQQNDVLEKCSSNIEIDNIRSLCLLSGTIGFMCWSQNLEVYVQSTLQAIVNISLQADTDLSSRMSNDLLCSLTNKLSDNIDNDRLIEHCLCGLKQQIGIKNPKAVETYSWIAKGMLIKGHTLGITITQHILDLLDDEDMCEVACFGIGIITKEKCDIDLPKKSLFFKQKMFHIISKKLLEKFPHLSMVHFNAFMHVLDVTPKVVIKMQIEKLAPVLFKCLNLDDVSSIQITLNIIKYFLEQRDDYFRSHLAHIMLDLIRLSQYKSSMKIRISALECISAVCNYPLHVTQHLKTDVLFGIVPALDDKKRLVRTAAVQARNAWFVLDVEKSNK